VHRILEENSPNNLEHEQEQRKPVEFYKGAHLNSAATFGG